MRDLAVVLEGDALEFDILEEAELIDLECRRFR